MSGRRDIWSELVPYSELRSGAVMRLLSGRGLRLLLAVQPAQLPEVASVARACAQHGVPLGLWPLLDDGDGRFGSARNADIFGDHLTEVLRAAERDGAAFDEVIFDLEPPIVTARALLALGAGAPAKWLPRLSAPRGGSRAFSRQVRQVREHGVASTAVVAPMVLGDPTGAEGHWQRLMGTPVDGPGFDRVAVMAYTSLFEGYGRGLVRRTDARGLLQRASVAAARRWGDRGSVALGVVGSGALGDERPYRSVAELEEDVATARACGVSHLSLHGLSGVLGSAHPEAWLEAFVATPPALRLPSPTLRGGVLLRAGDLAARAARALLQP